MTLGVFSSFDDITYNTKPIIQSAEKICKKGVINNLNDSLPNESMEVENNQHFFSDQRKSRISYDTNYWLDSEPTEDFEDINLTFNKNNSFTEKENKKKMENVLNIKPKRSVSNHAKIIREVLKKYPHLVQRHKNIRLKITQKESKRSEGGSLGKNKVSYVVLSSDSLKTDLDNNQYLTKNIVEYGLHDNKSGPWKCDKCNLDENYLNYSLYRRHMQGVHGYKFDPRICEYCGYKATKRNILMYHMYTKHDIILPKNISFPKCNLCAYVALSESLLLKHQNNHKHNLPTKKINSSHSDSIQHVEHPKNIGNVTNSDRQIGLNDHDIYLENQNKSCKNFNKSFNSNHHNKNNQIVKKNSTNEDDQNNGNLEISNILQNDAFFHDFNSDVIVYVENNKNIDVSFDCNKNPNNDKYFLNASKINEENKIVETISENQHPCNKIYEEKDSIQTDILNKNHTFSNLNENTTKSNMEESIQYIEEETEILEYETPDDS